MWVCITKWYILVVTWALIVYLIYTPLGLRSSGFGCIRTVYHSCQCCNYLKCMCMLYAVQYAVLNSIKDSILISQASNIKSMVIIIYVFLYRVNFSDVLPYLQWNISARSPVLLLAKGYMIKLGLEL